jgi:hypothetical protein
MPYSDPEKQREAQAKWARENYPRKKAEAEIKDLRLKTLEFEKTNILIPKKDVAQTLDNPLVYQGFMQLKNDPNTSRGTLSVVNALLMEKMEREKNQGENKNE